MTTGVVLAAGASQRMGRHKLLLPLDEEPLVRRTVRQVCEAGLGDVLVVLGREADRVRAALAGLPCRYAVNDEYESGMGSSFRVAVDHLGASDAALIALADQPFVTAAAYQRLLAVYREQAPWIVCARYGTITAPPHVFAHALFPELARLQHGARPVVAAHRAQTVIVDLAPELLLDIDTPDDYEKAVRLASDAR